MGASPRRDTGNDSEELRSKVEHLQQELEQTNAARETSQAQVEVLKHEVDEKDRQLKSQVRLSQQTMQLQRQEHMQTESGEALAMAQQTHEDEVQMLREQISTLQLFIQNEAVHGLRTERSGSVANRTLGNDSLQSAHEEEIEALDEKISGLETDLLATKLRNAMLEEENLILRNIAKKAGRAVPEKVEDPLPGMWGEMLRLNVRRGSV